MEVKQKGNSRSITLSYESKLYFICFVSIAAIGFGVFALFGKTFVWETDGYKQYYPLLANFRKILVSLFKGESISGWAAEIGLGAGTLGNISIILCDPFNYFVALFPLKSLDIGYTFGAFLRMYCAGYAMMRFLKYHGLHKEMCVLSGLSYAFCAWAIGILRHVFFLNPLILFPLIILGIDKVMDGKKPHLLIISVFLSLVSYVYFAYMSAIFAFLYVLIKCWCTDRPLKSCASLFLKLALYICVSCMMASPVLLAMAYSILHASKSTGNESGALWTIGLYLRFIPAFVNNTEFFSHYSYVGIGAPLTMGIPLVFTKLKEKQFKEYRILFLFSLISLLFPFWNRLMNGFSYAAGRWFYIYVFFAIAAVSFSMDIKADISKKEKRLSCLWFAVLFFSFIFMLYAQMLFDKGAIMSGVFNLLCMIVFLVKKPRGSIAFCLSVILCLSVPILFYNLPGFGNNLNIYMSAGSSYKIFESSLLRAYGDIQSLDGDFFRVNYDEHRSKDGTESVVAHTPANESLYWRSPTIYSYLSTVDSRLLQYNKELSNSSGYFNRVSTYSNDNRARLDFLTGVKYYLYEYDVFRNYESLGFHKKGDVKGVSVLESDYEAGLGYVLPYLISKEWYEDRNPLEKEELLMFGAVLPEKRIREFSDPVAEFDYSAYRPGVTMVPYQVSVDSDIIPVNHEFEVSEDALCLKLTTGPVEDSELYVEFVGLKRIPLTNDERIASLPNDTIQYRLSNAIVKATVKDYPSFQYYAKKDAVVKGVLNNSGSAQGLGDIDRFMSNVGYYDETSGEIELIFSPMGSYTFEELNVYALPANSFRTQAETLSNSRLTVTEFKNDQIIGTVESDYSGFLYLSLLHDPGWKAYVDGQEVEIYETDTCFMGFPVDSGCHEVRLVYHSIGYPYTIVTCILGIAAFALLSVPYKKKRKPEP